MMLTREEIKELQAFIQGSMLLEIKKPNQEQLKYAKEWLNDAKGELKAYKVLKRNNLNPQMVEHLALCVEKLVKSLGFVYCSVDQKTIKHEIGHISPRVFIKIIETTKATDFVDKHFPTYKEIMTKQNYAATRQLIMSRKVQNLEKQYMTLPKETIDILFKLIDEITLKLKIELQGKTVEEAYENSPQAKNALAPIMPIVKKTKEWKELKDKKITILYKMPSLHMTLFTLSILLFPFYNVSRYSTSYGVKFEKGLGIIDSIQEFEKRTISCIKSVEKEIRRIENLSSQTNQS